MPAPKSFTDAMVDLYENGDPVAIHGYSPSLGIPSVKDAIAENSTKRFGMAYTGNHIFAHQRGGARCPTRCVR